MFDCFKTHTVKEAAVAAVAAAAVAAAVAAAAAAAAAEDTALRKLSLVNVLCT